MKICSVFKIMETGKSVNTFTYIYVCVYMYTINNDIKNFKKILRWHKKCDNFYFVLKC